MDHCCSLVSGLFAPPQELCWAQICMASREGRNWKASPPSTWNTSDDPPLYGMRSSAVPITERTDTGRVLPLLPGWL